MAHKYFRFRSLAMLANTEARTNARRKDGRRVDWIGFGLGLDWIERLKGLDFLLHGMGWDGIGLDERVRIG